MTMNIGFVVAGLVLTVAGCDRTETPKPPEPVEASAPIVVATVSATPSAEPVPSASVVAIDTSCTKDGDCVPGPSCCPPPCTSYVINVKDMSKARAALHCDRAQKCMSAGACPGHAYQCMAKKCALVYSTDPGYRAPKGQ